MDRLETTPYLSVEVTETKFTFHYGQIRNNESIQNRTNLKNIYIPLWIDQKQTSEQQDFMFIENLHSTMDRLETTKK